MTASPRERTSAKNKTVRRIAKEVIETLPIGEVETEHRRGFSEDSIPFYNTPL
jgi:hypothetical protein